MSHATRIQPHGGPVNKKESAREPLPENHTLQGYVHQLHWEGNKCDPPVAPVFHDLLRKSLNGKQVQMRTIDDSLGRNPSLAVIRVLVHLCGSF